MKKAEDIKTTKDFIMFLYGLERDGDFLSPDSKENSEAICRTNFTSEVLYILPATHDLNNLANYNHLKFVTINSFKVGKKEIAILRAHKKKLEQVKFLYLWNIKQNDLDLLEFFPNVTHLLISYIRKPDFSFAGLDYLDSFNTLVLSSANRLTDFNFLTKQQKEKIKHLNFTYTSRLTKFDGLGDFKNLETLSLFASTMESRKNVTLESLNGVEKLSNLQSFEIDYFRFDMEELKDKLKHLKRLEQYKVRNQFYDNR